MALMLWLIWYFDDDDDDDDPDDAYIIIWRLCIAIPFQHTPAAVVINVVNVTD
jgi:hypothetical protein